jgi:hypothetical protein
MTKADLQCSMGSSGSEDCLVLIHPTQRCTMVSTPCFFNVRFYLKTLMMFGGNFNLCFVVGT